MSRKQVWKEAPEHWMKERDDSCNEKLIKEIKSQVIYHTERHRFYVDAIEKHSITICTGPAGTGKSFVASAKALELVLDQNRPYDRIICSRPIVGCGKPSGFQPGNRMEKYSPWIEAMKAQFVDLIGASRTGDLIKEGLITFEDFEYMRGKNFNNAVILVDEAQNCSYEELKLVLTRGKGNPKFIITGDVSQNDLHKDSDLKYIIRKLRPMEDFCHVKLTTAEILRSEITRQVELCLNRPPRNYTGITVSFWSK